MAIGIAFAVILQFLFSSFSAGPSAVSEAPLPIRGPLESVNAPKGVLELPCYDLDILPIWHELKKDSRFTGALRHSTGLVDCSEMVQVKRLDLNQDGTEEFLVRGKGPVQCGGIGNCNYWIFEYGHGSTRKLLASAHEADAHEFGVDEVQKSRNRGYSDFLLASYDAQLVLHFQTFRFDGTEYVESQCMSEVPRLLRDGPGSRDLITCEEFYRRRDQMRRAVGTDD